MWNLTSFAIDMKSFRIISWEVIWTLPWMQQKTWIPWQLEATEFFNSHTFGYILVTNITRSRIASFYSPWNDFCLAIVLGVLLQCWTLGIGLGVTSFNMPNIVTTKAFQHLLTIMSENWETLLWMIGLPYISIGYKVAQREFDSKIGILHDHAYVNHLLIQGANFSFV